MDQLNLSSTLVLAQPVNQPFTSQLIVFLIVFMITVLYSSLLLWLILKLFQVSKTRNKAKTAFFVVLISNLATSLLFGILRQVARLIIGQPFSSNKLLLVAVISLAFVFTLAINLLLEKKFYKLPAKQAFYVILSWTAISFLVANIITQLLAPLIVHLVSSFYQVSSVVGQSPAITLPA